MELLSFVANIASIFCLPATIIALPGTVAMFSDSFRSQLKRRKWIPSTILIVAVLVDAGAHYTQILGWFSPKGQFYQRTFANQEVLLDDNDYVDCTFVNITFKYNGGNYFIHNAKIQGPGYRLVTDNKTVSNTMTLINDLHGLGPNAHPYLMPN